MSTGDRLPTGNELRASGDAVDQSIMEKAREICLRALESRSRTRRELERKLEQKGISADAARLVLDRLTEVGLVNDEAYARTFVAMRQRTRPRGPRALAAELARRGVGDAVITRVLDEQKEVEEPREAARRALETKLRTLSGKPPEERRRKAEQFLLRRGFSYGDARDLLNELIESPEEDL